MKSLNIFLGIVLLVIFSSFLIFNNIRPVQAASAFEKFKAGYETTGGEAGYTSNLTKPLPEILAKIIQAVLSLLGIIFLLLMIYGGYIWMLARGNENETKRARGIITNAVIGLAVIGLAYVITVYVSKTIYNAQDNINIEDEMD